MSPHPDFQKYVGSYLISHQINNRNKLISAQPNLVNANNIHTSGNLTNIKQTHSSSTSCFLPIGGPSSANGVGLIKNGNTIGGGYNEHHHLVHHLHHQQSTQSPLVFNRSNGLPLGSPVSSSPGSNSSQATAAVLAAATAMATANIKRLNTPGEHMIVSSTSNAHHFHHRPHMHSYSTSTPPLGTPPNQSPLTGIHVTGPYVTGCCDHLTNGGSSPGSVCKCCGGVQVNPCGSNNAINSSLGGGGGNNQNYVTNYAWTGVPLINVSNASYNYRNRSHAQSPVWAKTNPGGRDEQSTSSDPLSLTSSSLLSSPLSGTTTKTKSSSSSSTGMKEGGHNELNETDKSVIETELPESTHNVIDKNFVSNLIKPESVSNSNQGEDDVVNSDNEIRDQSGCLNGLKSFASLTISDDKVDSNKSHFNVPCQLNLDGKDTICDSLYLLENSNCSPIDPSVHSSGSESPGERSCNNSFEELPINTFRALLSDGLNMGSEDSSGNSEKSLPRVIKPRKRRKKDRKNAQQQEQQLLLLLKQQQQKQNETTNGILGNPIESISVDHVASSGYPSSYLMPSGSSCSGHDTMHYIPFMLTYGQTGYPFSATSAHSAPVHSTNNTSNVASSSSSAPGYTHHANHSSSSNGSQQQLSNYGLNYSTDLILPSGCGYGLDGPTTGRCKSGLQTTKKNCDKLFYVNNNSPSSSPLPPLTSKGAFHAHQETFQHLHQSNLQSFSTLPSSKCPNLQSDCRCLDCLSPGLISSRSSSSAFLTPPMSPLVDVGSFHHHHHLHHHHLQQQKQSKFTPSNTYNHNESADLQQHLCDIKLSEVAHNPELEFRTRIVTNPSGGRDLEIKFLNLSGSRQVSWSQNDPLSSSHSPASLSPYLTSEESNSGFSINSYELNHTRPPQRPWISLGTPDRTRTTSIFTVMCYNVLCDKYATRQMYGYCPKWAMKWEYRRGSILNEIRTYTADIISLQELETEQFYNYFLPELKRDGYDGIFSPKSRAKTMSENERKHVDGCAIFYRTSKFTLLKEHLVEFNQLAMANAEGSDDMLNRVMTKDNIGLAALLQTKEGAFEPGILSDPSQALHPILVCTAHIHWDPEYCDVKLIQTMMLMHELRQIVEDSAIAFRPGASKPDANNVPLILCGDLNSLPNSGVIEYLSNGRISADHADFKELGYKDSLKKLGSSTQVTSDNKTEYIHPFKINRAYADDVMPYTNYTFDFKGVIDYIFYSKQHMSVLGLLGPLDSEWFKENKVVGCPHPHVPSDHFPLIVEFELTPPAMNHLQHSNGMLLRR